MKSACAICRCIKEDGTPCQRPALRRMRYCYSHQQELLRRVRMRAERSRQRWFESVALDDPNAIQVAIAKIMQCLIAGEVDHDRAGQLLYTMQNAIATLNLDHREPANQHSELRLPIPRDFPPNSSSNRGGSSQPCQAA